MPPAYVKPYIKRQNNDAADAEAICEAAARANRRFVDTKIRSSRAAWYFIARVISVCASRPQ